MAYIFVTKSIPPSSYMRVNSHDMFTFYLNFFADLCCVPYPTSTFKIRPAVLEADSFAT